MFVLRSASLVDYLAITDIVARLGLPPVAYASDVPHLLAVHDEESPELPDPLRLERAVSAGKSAVFSLKRSRGLVALPRSGDDAGDERLSCLLALQDRLPASDIMLVPVTFLWTMRSEKRGFSVIDSLFGSTDMPGDARAVTQFLFNYRNCAPRAGDPLSLQEFTSDDPVPGPARVRRLTYALLRRVERERRAVVGPARKSPDRVREEVLRSAKLRHVVADMVKNGGADPVELSRRTEAILRELSAMPSPEIVSAIEPLADALVHRVFTGIDVDEAGIDRVREAARRGTIVLLPSHKSHVDYLILSYVLKKHSLELPLIASGDNLSFFPVGAALRRGGAFFIRRSFRGDKLYAAVVDAYVRRIIRDGWAIEFFLEGGRSRTGKLLPPQVGLLNLVVDAALELEPRPVAFVPVSIVYERTMEEVELMREKAGAPKERESARSLLAVGEALLQRYGRVNVRFGRVVDLAAFRTEIGADAKALTPAKRRSLVTKLAQVVMSEINRVTAVTAGSLVAMVLLDMEARGLGHRDLVLHASRLLRTAARAGARPAPTLSAHVEDGIVVREASIREATLLFVRSGLVKQHVPDDTLAAAALRPRLYVGPDVVYSVPEETRARLDLAKMAIIHFFVDRAIVSIALLGAPQGRATRGELEETARTLNKLFEREFSFRTPLSAEEAFDATLADMVSVGELALVGDVVTFGAGDADVDGATACRAHARHLESFIEAYRVAARTLRVLCHGPLGEKELLSKALAVGRQMFVGGEIDRREAVSRPTIDAAFAAFVEAGYIKKSDDTFELLPAHRAEANVRAIEATIARHQVGKGRGDA